MDFVCTLFIRIYTLFPKIHVIICKDTFFLNINVALLIIFRKSVVLIFSPLESEKYVYLPPH